MTATTMAVDAASRVVMEEVGLRYVRTSSEDRPQASAGSEHGEVEYALSREDRSARTRTDGP
jgi:hypothetical protein